MVLVKAASEVYTLLCPLLVTVSLAVLHFRCPFHIFRKKEKEKRIKVIGRKDWLTAYADFVCIKMCT